MNAPRTVFTIRRFRPGADSAPVWRQYRVRTAPGTTVLEALQQIREEQDATLSWRSSCRMGVCGSCAMVVNGQPCLACNTQVHDVDAAQIRLEPLANFQLIKDLVTDLAPMFAKHRALQPWLVREEPAPASAGELAQTPAELEDYLQFSYCIKCGACMSACPTLASDPHFAGPMPLTAAHRYNADSRDGGAAQRAAAMDDLHAATHCHYAGECTRVCPKGVDPALAIQLLKRSLLARALGLRPRRATAAVLQGPSSTPPREVPAVPPFTAKRS